LGDDTSFSIGIYKRILSSIGAPNPPSKQDILNQLAVALQKGQMLLMHQGVTKLRHAQRLKAFR
jgi:hypothetical protein